MNEEEKNITATPAETAAAPKRRGRPRKNPLPAETNELPLENTTKPAKAETECLPNWLAYSTNAWLVNEVAW